MSELLTALAAPFDPAIISWRIGPTNREKTKGMALAYIDARDVMRRLDEVCGPENWQNDYPWSDGKRVVCRIGIRIGGEWLWKTDGAGDTDTEGEKGALSDAFKRAAVHWGIGRYLYDTETPWIEIEQRGNSYIIPDRERARLTNLLRHQPKVVDESDTARQDYAKLTTAFRAAPDIHAIAGLWTIHKDAIARIQKHGGEAAMTALHKVAQDRIDALGGQG